MPEGTPCRPKPVRAADEHKNGKNGGSSPLMTHAMGRIQRHLRRCHDGLIPGFGHNRGDVEMCEMGRRDYIAK